jgi:hypothetical protein
MLPGLGLRHVQLDINGTGKQTDDASDQQEKDDERDIMAKGKFVMGNTAGTGIHDQAPFETS